jgi:formylglycine-generating enzyme required for sulfatase activity
MSQVFQLPAPFEWVDIPRGSVIIEGQTKSVSAFVIAKYPITNAQYQVFVDDPNGYTDSEWWDYSSDAQQWRAENKQPQTTAFEGNDHPRTNVTWFEAVAFCRWLSEKTKQSLMLPTETQWHCAAYGDNRYKYPWGDEFDENRCNTHESDIGATTPVTRYPNGASPYGVIDMIGNVWEWCLTDYDTSVNDITVVAWRMRVCRGGSWYNHKDFSHSSFRGRNVPESFHNFYGFRICSSS